MTASTTCRIETQHLDTNRFLKCQNEKSVENNSIVTIWARLVSVCLFVWLVGWLFFCCVLVGGIVSGHCALVHRCYFILWNNSAPCATDKARGTEKCSAFAIEVPFECRNKYHRTFGLPPAFPPWGYTTTPHPRLLHPTLG